MPMTATPPSAIRPDQSVRWNWLLWPLAVIFTAITLLLVVDTLNTPSARNADGLLTTGIFVLMDAAAVGGAIYVTVRRRKFGASRLELATCPAVIGEELVGEIVIPNPKHLTNDVHVRLSCIERRLTGGRGGNPTVLWQAEQTLTPASSDDQGSRVPVRFAIPHHCSPTNHEDKIIRWQLSATSPTPGVDFYATFRVPVVKVQQSRPGKPQ
jgi:hypothetical protein